MSYFNIFLDLIYIQSDAMFINLKKIYFHLIKYLIIDLIINYLFIIQDLNLCFFIMHFINFLIQIKFFSVNFIIIYFITLKFHNLKDF